MTVLWLPLEKLVLQQLCMWNNDILFISDGNQWISCMRKFTSILQILVGVFTVINWYLVLIFFKCSFKTKQVIECHLRF